MIGFIGTSLQLQSIITAHTLNSAWTTSAWRISWRISYCCLGLGLVSTTRIHEYTTFYNCHAAGIEVTMSKSSSVLLCCHGNAFLNIRCHGNKFLPSSCLAKITSASAIIPAFRQCLPSRCLEKGHIPSQYHYIITRKPLDSTFNIEWEPKLSYQKSVEHTGLLFHKVSYSKYDKLSQMFTRSHWTRQMRYKKEIHLGNTYSNTKEQSVSCFCSQVTC
jgi:hypothetical protein